MKFLVIIPFFNTEDFLKGAIEGILQQEHKDIHICLVNDGSTDGSLAVAQQYASLPNVTLIENEVNRGAYYSVNHALSVCKDIDWDYFHFHGSDDVSDTRRFRLISEFIAEHGLDAIKSTFVRFHADTNEMAYENGKPHITTSEGTAFYSRGVFEKIGYYDNSRFSADTDYWLRVEQSHKVNKFVLGAHTQPLVIGYLRKNKSNLTVQIPIHTRGEYYNKISKEIQQMIASGDFYRDKFE